MRIKYRYIVQIRNAQYSILLFFLLLFSFYGCLDDLSVAPPRNGVKYDTEKMFSQISAHVKLEFIQLQNLANREIPMEIKLPDGNGKDVCKKIGPVTDLPFGGKLDLRKKVCAGTKFSELKIKRLSNISIGPSPIHDMIRISAPLHLSGKVGFRGDGAKALALDAKKLKADIEAYIDIGIDIDENWCPKVRTRSDFRFIKGATLEVIHRVNIGVSGQVENPLRKQLHNFATQVGSKIDCSMIKKDIERFWSARSIPIELSSEEKAWANLEPISAGFTGSSISNDAIIFGIVLKAQTEIATSPTREFKKSLPKLERLQPVGTKFDLKVPFRTTYDRISKNLNELVANREFTEKTSFGLIRITAKEFDVYSSDGRLVVGVLIHAILPTKFFKTKGWIYLYGEPRIIHSGQGLSISNVEISLRSKDDFWKLANQIIGTKIKSEIERGAEVDFRDEIQQTYTVLQQQLVKEDSKSKVYLTLNKPQIGIKKVVLLMNEIVALSTFSADAHLEIALK